MARNKRKEGPEVFYLASPFFNSRQLSQLQSIEACFDAAGVAFFSPRLQDSPGPVLDAATAARRFAKNLAGFEQCTAVLANLDYLLAGVQEELRVVMDVVKRPGDDSQTATLVSPGLLLPDVGTVWEMGLAYGLDLPVVCFTQRPDHCPLNIMLTASCKGVLRNFEALKLFLAGKEPGRVNWEVATEWKGKHQ